MPRATARWSRPPWGGGWSTPPCRRVDGLARGDRAAPRAARHHPRPPGRVRPRLAPGRGSRMGCGLRRPGRGRARWTRARRVDPWRGQSRRDGRPEAGVPPRRHRDRRQRLAAQRRRLRGAARQRDRRRTRSGGPRWRASPAARPTPWSRSSSGFAPVEAANLALKRAGIAWGDVRAVELNEAFAAQSLACRRLGRRPRDRQPARRCDRHRTPPRRVGHAHPGHAGPVDGGVGRALGRRRHLHRCRPGAGRRPREPTGGLSHVAVLAADADRPMVSWTGWLSCSWTACRTVRAWASSPHSVRRRRSGGGPTPQR